MPLFLSAHDTSLALPYREAIGTLERGFVAFARGEYVVPQRLVLQADHGTLVAMPAADRKIMGMKVATIHPNNGTMGIPTVQATVLLLRGETGELLSILDGTSLTVIRTAAASAVATRHLANEGPADLGIIGSGALAVSHVRAISLVRPIGRVRIFSPHARQRWNAISTQLKDLEHEIELAESPEQVARTSSILVLVTSSTRPVIHWSWIEPGTHINAVGSHTPTSRELDADTLINSRVICDSVEACWAEAGDLLIPWGEGLICPDTARVSLGDVLVGRAVGRETREQVTIFKSVGLAFEDLCAAFAAWENARASGSGTYWTVR